MASNDFNVGALYAAVKSNRKVNESSDWSDQYG